MMEKIGLFRAMGLCRAYSKMDVEARRNLREERLRRVVMWAKQNSPFYRELYGNVGEDFDLSELPPVSKPELMASFDRWCTDPRVRLADVERFMENADNVGRRYLGKYLVYTTSGSTGNPLVSLCDPTTEAVMGAVNATRAFARKSDLKSFFLRGGKTMGVFATGGFYLSNSSVRARLLKMPWKKRQLGVTSALLPIPEIVRQLNAFQPAMLGGYPSNLELLIDERQSGRLNISPMLIMTGGERLSPELRTRLTEAFGCYVQTSYSCTEGGTLACECVEQHFHVNDDWVILEPVDAENRPVPDGVQSDKLLLTNLSQFSQPYIRYELTDRVVMHHDRCPCGNPSPWLELEGRTDDAIRLAGQGREIKLAPLTLYATLKEVRELRRFQLVAQPGNRLWLRLEPVPGVSRQAAFECAKTALEALLAVHGASEVSIFLSPDAPCQHPKSGKYKHIIQENP